MPCTNHFMLRLALLILPLATLDCAQAANKSNAASPVNNTINICSKQNDGARRRLLTALASAVSQTG